MAACGEQAARAGGEEGRAAETLPGAGRFGHYGRCSLCLFLSVYLKFI